MELKDTRRNAGYLHLVRDLKDTRGNAGYLHLVRDVLSVGSGESTNGIELSLVGFQLLVEFLHGLQVELLALLFFQVFAWENIFDDGFL